MSKVLIDKSAVSNLVIGNVYFLKFLENNGEGLAVRLKSIDVHSTLEFTPPKLLGAHLPVWKLEYATYGEIWNLYAEEK